LDNFIVCSIHLTERQVVIKLKRLVFRLQMLNNTGEVIDKGITGFFVIYT